MKNKALFLNLPLILGSDFIDYPYFANLGLLHNAGILLQKGWEVTIADSFAFPQSSKLNLKNKGYILGIRHNQFIKSLPQQNFDIVVIGNNPFLCIESPHPETVQTIKEIRELYPDSRLILADCYIGGMHYWDYDPNDVISRLPEIDLVIKYEGEKAFEKIEELICNTKAGGRTVILPVEGKDLGEMPFPAFHLLDLDNLSRFLSSLFSDKLWKNTFNITPKTFPMMTGRGCIFRCIFCSSNPGRGPTRKKLYQYYPFHYIKDWIYLLSKGFGADKIFIMDDVANLHPEFIKIIKYLNELNLSYEFPNGLRADFIDNDIIDIMSGRISILSVSAESGVQKNIDRRIKKNLDLSHIIKVAAACSQKNVPLLVHFTIGYPWEKKSDIEATLAFAYNLYESYGALPSIQFAVPMRGTELYEICEKKNLLPRSGIDMKDGALFQHRPVYNPPGMEDGYLQRCREIFFLKLHSYRSKKVIINITYKCNNSCIFCAVGNRIKGEIPLKKLKEKIAEYRKKGYENIDFDGGEPTLHPNLLEIIDFTKHAGYTQINVTTNGRKMSDPQICSELLNSGITSLLISIHGHTKEIHEAATTVEGSFSQTVEGIKNTVALKHPRIDFGINTTVSTINLNYLEEFTEFIISLGVKKINFQMITPFGNAKIDECPPPKRCAEKLIQVIERYKDKITINVINAPPCLFTGYEKFVVGDIQKLGRTMIFVTEEEVNLFKYLAAKRTKNEKCTNCVYSQVCEGFYLF